MTAPNRFLDAVERRRLADREAELTENVSVRADLRNGKSQPLPKRGQRGAVIPEARLEAVARLKRLDVSNRDIAATLGLTERQVAFAALRVKRRAEDAKRKERNNEL